MEVIGSVKDLKEYIRRIRPASLGFVPTMGALHEGHLSLVRSAMNKCPVVVVSIYVNPTQFNDKEDLRNYPRTLEADKTLLGEIMRYRDILFTPDDREIYPVEDKRIFDFGNPGKVMEALHRPGHFNGVAQVVSRLFEIVDPDFAWFGLKDFQQLAVIKELVRQTRSRVSIIPGPIIREYDGLAMSSRNSLLDPGIRKEAGIIFSTISTASQMLPARDIPEIRDFVFQNIGLIKGFEVEYFEIVDDVELIPVKKRADMKKSKRYFGCIAVKAGKVRLIDNIEIKLNQSKG